MASATQAALFEDAHALALLINPAGMILAASAVVGALPQHTEPDDTGSGQSGSQHTDRSPSAMVQPSSRQRSPVGLGLSDLYPERVARERLADASHCLHTRATRHLRGFLHGCWTLSTLRPAVTPAGEPAVLCTIAPITDSPFSPTGAHAPLAHHHDLGRLAALSAREIEVLRLLGLGLPTATIAEQLGRSAKTIEGHRVSLGSKLRLSTRVEVARVAINSGITRVPSDELSMIMR